MNLSRSRTSMMRTTSAVVMAAAAMVAVLPGIANATPATPVVAHTAAADEAERSVWVTLKNKTSLQLTLDDASVSEGVWIQFPPNSVKRKKIARFGTESDEVGGGTSANVSYDTEFGSVELYWRSPAFGDPKFSCDTPDGIVCDFDEDLDENARVTFELYEEIR
ncbi:hypothetical protein ACIBSW_21250 [Actinoplanes sp. NPDC049668]|uniref:hypothetical protein n=1 Tax=unclassified Actinoplanes TaxID=2626549 RepID=UPI0033AE063B